MTDDEKAFNRLRIIGKVPPPSTDELGRRIVYRIDPSAIKILEDGIKDIDAITRPMLEERQRIRDEIEWDYDLKEAGWRR